MSGTQVISLPGGSVPVNALVVEIIDIIKPQAIELVTYCNQVGSYQLSCSADRWEITREG